MNSDGEWRNWLAASAFEADARQGFVGSNPTSPAKILMGVSSIGRAAGFDPVGYRFESCTPCQVRLYDSVNSQTQVRLATQQWSIRK